MITTRERSKIFLDDPVQPIVAFKTFRIIDGELRSRHLPVTWRTPVMEADCYRDLPTPFRSTSRYVHEPHTAPHPDCSCGITAEYTPDLRFPKVDFQGVTAVVALWGAIEAESAGYLRAEAARVCALGLYAHASLRQRAAVADVAADMEADVVDLRELAHAAQHYGRLLVPVALTAAS